MILENPKRDIQLEGIEDTHKMSISLEAQAHVIKLVTEFAYSKPLESGIRETLSNNLDSVQEAGADEPVIVSFEQNNSNYELSFEDKGLGLSKENFYKYIMGIGESTKRNNPTLRGGYGSGSKCWLSYTDSYFYICRKDGIECKFMIFKGEELPEATLLYEKPTEEKNGVKVIIPVKSWNRNDVINAVKEQCSYFKNVWFNIQGLNNQYKIFETEHFRFNELDAFDKMHVVLLDVAYPLDFKKLGISDIYVPIALRFDDYNDLKPDFTRENIQYNKQSIEAIKNKIKQVSEWFVNKYNEDTKEYNTLREAWNNINTSKHYVKIHDTNFEITDLEKYSDIKFNNIKVKGIDYIPLSKFRSNYDYIVKQYKIVGEVKWNGKFSEKNATSYKGHLLEKKCLLINDNVSITGWFKEWLKQTNYQIFIKYDYYAKKEDLKFYKQLLELEKYPKQDWRKVIQEWQRVKKEFVSTLFTDGTDFHNSQEFIDFRNENKSNKKYQSLSSYNRLNKQKGDITIHVPIPKYHNCNEYKLEKQVFKIEKLHQQKYKFVVLTEEQKEECKKLARYFRNFNNYKFVVVTKGEIKKLPTIKNIIMFAKIEKRPSDLKLFSKIASAALYSKELEKFNRITYNLDSTILQSFSNNLSENIQKLESFTKLYSGNYGDAEAIIQKAIETNDFDLTNDAEYQQLKQFNDKFSFVQFLKCDRYNKSEFIKELNTQLLMRRLYKPETYSQFEICLVEKKQKETVILEQEVA